MKKSKSRGDHNRGYHLKLGLIAAFSFLLASFDWADYSIDQARYKHFNDVEDVIFTHVVQQVEMEKPKQNRVNQNTTQIQISEEDNIDSKELDNTKDITKMTPNLVKLGEDGDWEDPIDDILPDLGPQNVNTVEIAPYYLDCKNVLDREEQGNCSYGKIKNYIQKVADYPEICRSVGIEGTVWVEFTVSTTGEISDVQVARSVHSKLDAAAVKAVKQLPKMEPGSQQGHFVTVKYQIPVDFIIAH